VGAVSGRVETNHGQGSNAIALGCPIANTRVLILKDSLQLALIGEAGELCVGGHGVARGYLDVPDLTAEKFIPDPYGSESGSRLYRTGDRARYLEDGSLEFLGRMDRQVKVRGFRVELAEIESVLVQHPGIRETAVVALDCEVGGKRLVAYLAGEQGQEVSRADLQSFLAAKLPDYMVPSAFVQLRELPLTPNGKIDYAALPEPDQENAKQEYVAPRTAIEEMLCDVWSETLQAERVGVHDDFFELGGHSLLVMLLVSRVRDVFGVEIPLGSVFEQPTVAMLAQVIEAAMEDGEKPATPPLEKVSRGQSIPLSFAQQRLWFIDQLEPGSTVYNIPLAKRLVGRLNVAVLERALSEVLRRHESLRTSFQIVGGEATQVIAEAAPLRLVVTDLSGLANAESEAQRLMDEEAQHSFDLARGPLFRARLLKLAEEQHVLLLTLHHIVSDGWSMDLLFKELSVLHNAYARGEETPLGESEVQYADYSVWQRQWLKGEVLEKQLAYWKQQLGETEVLELPTDRPRPAVQSYKGAAESFLLPEQLSRQLKELSRREGMTLFMTLLAAFQVLLSRYSGQEEVLVASPILGRNRVELESVIGCFINTLVMRGDLRHSPNFLEVLKRTREVCLGAYAHQDIPFDKLVEELHPERSLSQQTLFQVMFQLQNDSGQTLSFDGLTVKSMRSQGQATKCDLTLSMFKTDDALGGTLRYSRDLFDRETIQRMIGHLQQLLESAVADPEQPIGQLSLLGASERQQLLSEWNETGRAYPEESMGELFEAQVRERGEAIAVACGEVRVSYGELNERANRLGQYLREQGVRAGSLVGILLERSEELVIALLATIKVGAAYLPLDPGYPRERLRLMLADAGAPLLLTESQLAGSVAGSGARVVCVDREREEIAEQPGENLKRAVSAGSVAYVIYTSGSTGRPKGILIPQRAVVRLVKESDYVRLGPGDKVAQVSNSSFDAATFEIWGALLNGAELVILSKEVALAPRELAGALREREISTLFLTTALFNHLAREAEPGFGGLKQLLFGGEAVDPESVAQVLAKGGPERLLHVYGPSESTTFASWQLVAEVAAGARTIPIGKPLTNTTAYILDEGLEAVPVGVPGELYLGGAGLAYGYLNQAGVTAEKFIPHPYGVGRGGERLYRTGDWARYGREGAIEFLGRRDQQVKLRGFRIELGEIEAALCAQEQVRQAVVIARSHGGGEKTLVAYVVKEGAGELSSRELRGYLSERLPEYMVPAAFVWLASLPLTPNGKVDRAALPEPQWDEVAMAGEYVGPRSALEEVLANIWAEVLGLERVSIHDDFFALGGHSLLATRLVSRVRETLGINLSLRELFEAPTVAGLSIQAEQGRRGGERAQPPPLVPAARDKALPLSFAQQRLWLIDRLEPGSDFYNVTAGRRLQGPLDVIGLERSLNELVQRHESLRTTFPLIAGQPAQVVAEAQPVRIEVTDLTHTPLADSEEEARRLASEEAQRPFDLSQGPLLRARLLRLGTADHVLLLNLHHIISDGWSMGVLFRELSTLYNYYVHGVEAALQQLPVQYADYAIWQRGWLGKAVIDEQLGYWTRQLRGAPALLELPTDRPRPAVQSRAGAHEPLVISSELTEQLKQVSKREGATLFMTLMAAFQILLARLSKQEDILVGTNVAGRDLSELEGLIGFFVNTVIIRTNFSDNPTLREVLSRVREHCLDAHAHPDVPFDKLVEILKPKRSANHWPLFQVKFDLLKNARLALNLPNITSKAFAYEGEKSRYDMFLILSETENGLRGVWTYTPDLFDSATIERLTREFTVVLEKLVTIPETRMNALTTLGNGLQKSTGGRKASPGRFKEFKARTIKPLKLSRHNLIKAEPLIEGRSLPLLLQPQIEGLELSAWAANNRDFIATKLREHGALLFRNFNVDSLRKFEEFIKATSGEPIQYHDRSSPRSQISGNIYSSTDHPADQPIFLHNENSYSYSWPLKLFFHCVTPPLQGGETLIADNRRLSNRIDQEIKNQFMKRSVRYVRNFGHGFGLPWQTVFQTDDKNVLADYCQSVGIEIEWIGPNRLRTHQVRPALAEHPETGELLWFNHAVFFHISTLETSLRESLTNGLAEADLPYNTYYGDGTSIEPEFLSELREIYRQETVLIPWQRADVLMLDNMLAAHGRQPYSGQRKIVVGMAQPWTPNN
jgi:amino acid adenylation domain-containing protein